MKEVIRSSFERCLKKGLRADSIVPSHVPKKQMQKILKDNELFIRVFKEEIDSLKIRIKNDLLFIITDINGIMLHFEATDYFKGKEALVELREGLDFSEDSCGTNAISIAMELKTSVETKRNNHFCIAFRNWHCFATPIYGDNKLIGYLSVSTVNKNLRCEFKIIVELLSLQMTKVYCDTLKKCANSNSLLSSSQIKILKYISRGYIENKIASKMNLSLFTIKYHKKIIFNKLGVNSSSEAISKSIRLGIIE